MTRKPLVFTTLLAILALSPPLAEAHPPGRGGWHGGVGVYFGGPYPVFPYPYAPYAYPYPYVYSPPPVVISQPQPPVYIEQGTGTSSAPATAPSAPVTSAGNSQAYWYYCEQSDSYYPYVKECAAGWKQVMPTPPAAPAK